MAVTPYNIKKWIKMITGNSLLHVRQGCGSCFVSGSVKGYFNDLTKKVVLDPVPLERNEVPTYPTELGTIVTPVGVFQYGLGAYDLFLQTNDEKYRRIFFTCVNWATSNNRDGIWINPQMSTDEKISSMTQGEGASLLIRAYIESHDSLYLEKAQQALERMLEPVEEGGTAVYDNGLELSEFPGGAIILNGWIFSLFGMYDFCQINPIKRIRESLDLTLATLEEKITSFDNGYWSMYDCEKRIASPFYHDLHIAQLSILLEIYPSDIIKKTLCNFIDYRDNSFNRMKAFIIKAKQKVFE